MDPFFDVDPLEARRDGNDEPMILPRGVTDVQLRQPYTRASSLSGYIADNRHLVKWEKRYLAKGMGLRPDLAAMAAAEPYTTGLHRPDDPAGLRANAASGRRIDKIAGQALEHAGVHERANYGTAIHSWTEPGNHNDVANVFNAEADVASFWAKVAELGIEILATEVFTANDEVRSAGTFDHLMRIPGYGVVVADKKTGALDGHEFGIQLAVYAYGDIYDTATDGRIDLNESVDGELNTDVGIIIRIRDGRTTLHEVDLQVGREAAQHAAWVRDYQGIEMIRPAEAVVGRAIWLEQEALHIQIAEAPDRHELVRLWQTNSTIWTAGHTVAAAKRKAEVVL